MKKHTATQPASPQLWVYRFSAHQDPLRPLLKAIQEGQRESEMELVIHRYFQEVSPGDTVLLFQSGQGSGFYGAGQWTSSPYFSLEGKKRQRQVGIVFTHVLNKPLALEQLKNAPGLQNLELLKRPQSRLFKLSDKEASTLSSLFQDAGEKPLIKAPSYSNPMQDAYTYAIKQGFTGEKALFRRYGTALKTSPLVILKGPSGIGKTWLTELYAQATGAEHLLLPVSPQWLSADDLLGYYHPIQQKHLPTPLWHFIKDAQHEFQRALQQGRDPRAYHVVLDEMNLGRIEHYFSPFLSALEVRRRQGFADIHLLESEALRLTPNLYFIGTLNEDEHVQIISGKVYDRAQVIALYLNKDMVEKHLKASPWKPLLLELWEKSQVLTQIGFRVLDEINQYIELNLEWGVSWQEALDEQVLQKILPRISQVLPHRETFLLQMIEATQHLPQSNERLEALLEQHNARGYF